MKELLGIDWRNAWIEYNRARKAPDDAEFWSGRAKSFSHYSRVSDYTRTFIDYMAAEPGSSFLDMGSGSGTLAIPLARAGHSVIAADFSAGMLSELEHSIVAEGLSTIRTVQLDFNAPWSTWEAQGIREKSVDIALASRSTMVDDLWEAIEKLERAARKKVAITLATSLGPRSTRRLGELMEGVKGSVPFVPDYVFAMNILFQMERLPTLRFINADKVDKEGTIQKVLWAYVDWELPTPSS
jgi:SAM-dependent methyltransferase